MLGKDSMRIAAVSDVQGNFEAIHQVYNESVEYIIHTGNFGFWDQETIEDYKDLNYLKQIVSFSKKLDSRLVEELNNLSTIKSNANNNDKDYEIFTNKLRNNPISDMELYLKGHKRLPCPVYTTFGPLDDPKIINKFQIGEYQIPNLYIIDHLKIHEIINPNKNQPSIKIYGISGNVKIHNLFDHGNLNYEYLSGKVGDLWITLTQISQLYMMIQEEMNAKESINIFVSYAPIIKSPILEHLAIITHANFTISQGLHFRYPVMGNGMSFVDSMGGSAGYIENYRSKFSRLRLILGELWVVVKKHILEVLEQYPKEESTNLRQTIEIGLKIFDKIPISINETNDKIIPLTFGDEEEEEEVEENYEIQKQILKKINDYYFSAYYNLWHFNLTNLIMEEEEEEIEEEEKEKELNMMIFKLTKYGNFKLDYCKSQGFNFNFKKPSSPQSREQKPSIDAIEYSPKTGIKREVFEDNLIRSKRLLERGSRSNRARGKFKTRAKTRLQK